MDFFKIGDKYFESRDFQQAIHFYLRGLSNDPNQVKPLTKLCIAYYEINEYREAIDTANRILNVDQNNQNALAYRAYSYHKLYQFSKAEIDYSSLIELDPFDEFFYLHRSNVRRKQGKFVESDKDLSKYEMLSDKSTGYFFTCIKEGVEDEDLDEFNLVRQRLDAILKEDPKNYEAYFNLGIAFTKIQEYNSAIDSYTRAMELYPGKIYKEALFNRVNAHFDNKQYQKCLKDIDLYIKEVSINPYLEELTKIIREERNKLS